MLPQEFPPFSRSHRIASSGKSTGIRIGLDWIAASIPFAFPLTVPVAIRLAPAAHPHLAPSLSLSIVASSTSTSASSSSPPAFPPAWRRQARQIQRRCYQERQIALPKKRSRASSLPSTDRSPGCGTNVSRFRWIGPGTARSRKRLALNSKTKKRNQH